MKRKKSPKSLIKSVNGKGERGGHWPPCFIMKKDMRVQFLCKDCDNFSLCQYYHGRKKDSYICKYFHLSDKLDKTWEEVKALPSVKPQYTDDEIQKMQELEQAEIQKAYELGKTEGQKSEDAISRQVVEDKLLRLCNELEGIFSDIREKNVDDSVCGLCEYDCDHGLSGYANECPGFETDECFKLADEIRHEWQSTKDLPSVNPQPICEEREKGECPYYAG